MIKKIIILTICFLITFSFLPLYPAIAKEEKVVYLTFDDGPSKNTLIVLDTLKEEDIKATFFVLGSLVKNNSAILKRIEKEGHTIGVHSYSHDYKEIYSSTESLKTDIIKCKEEINKVLPGYNIKYYRFPGGSFGLNEEIKKVPTLLGLKSIDWNCTCGDGERTQETFLSHVQKTYLARKKVVFLMHDAPSKRESALSLKEIIKFFKEEGYAFKSL